MTRRALLLALPAGACAIDTRQQAPKFRARTLGGETYDNESLKGRPVMIQLWTTWCKFCRRDQPAVEALIQEFSAQHLMVLAVNIGEPRRKVEEYLKSAPRASKIVLTGDTNLGAMLGPQGFPYYLMLDSDGKVVGDQRGSAGEEALRDLVRKAIPSA
jgi:thiol-disulfide isomerase/thioredoxin